MIPVLLEATLRSTALWLAAWLLLKALGVRDARAEKSLWTLVIAVSLAMPVLMHAITLPSTDRISILTLGRGGAESLLDSPGPDSLATALTRLYLAITAVLLLRFTVRLAGAFRTYHSARFAPTSFPAQTDLRVSDEIRIPCTFASSVLVPPDFDGWSPTARAAALAHEYAHVIHRDCYRLWLATLYSCVFWFNPVAWLVRRRLTLLAELTSDQAALPFAENPTAYAELLVQLASRSPRLEAAMPMSGRTHLPERIHHILESNMFTHQLSLVRGITLAGASFLAATICIGCASRPHVLSQAEDSKVSWVGGAPLGQYYPVALRKRHVEGDVVVKLVVDRAGKVTNASVVNEAPAGSGLGVAAVNAARTFRFNNTLAEPVVKTIDVKFALAD